MLSKNIPHKIQTEVFKKLKNDVFKKKNYPVARPDGPSLLGFAGLEDEAPPCPAGNRDARLQTRTHAHGFAQKQASPLF